jgi:hypothetical protein
MENKTKECKCNCSGEKCSAKKNSKIKESEEILSSKKDQDPSNPAGNNEVEPVSSAS